MKRSVDDDHKGITNGQPSEASNKKAKVDEDEVDDDDDLPLYAPSRLSSQKRHGKDCPYLDTVSRQVNDTLQTLPAWLHFSVIDPTFTPQAPVDTVRALQALDFDFEARCSVSLRWAILPTSQCAISSCKCSAESIASVNGLLTSWHIVLQYSQCLRMPGETLNPRQKSV